MDPHSDPEVPAAACGITPDIVDHSNNTPCPPQQSYKIMWLPFADSLLPRDPTLSLQSSSSSSETCEMAILSHSRSNHGSSWSLSGTVFAAILVMAALASGASGASGASVTTRDDGDTLDHSGLVMTTMQDNRLFSVILNQLPSPRPEQFTRSIKVEGDLVLYTVNTDRQLQSSDLAFISCDDGNATATFQRAIYQTTKPYCVIFFTVEHDSCNYNPEGTYSSVFTTLDREQANDFQLLLNNTDHLDVRIDYNKSADEDNQSSNVLGPAPSTSVALIILYSITGVITTLFLLIIIIGAIRAHRHPERYGPRATARFGRPRQSRAKGLARAVLDTLPIVRFGDAGTVGTGDDVVKPADMEMQTGSVKSRDSGEGDGKRTSTASSVESRTNHDGGDTGEATSIAARDAEEPEMSTAEMDPLQLQCPVCMEDFESGQDLRVLPCHHSFHPDCIDPWLLNVAGSCPLCRIDLRPEDQRHSLELPPAPPEPEHTPSRFMRYLDIAHRTSGEERMAALRQLREEQRGSGALRPRSRAPELGISRLKRVFHRRMSGSRSSAASTGESSSSATPSVAGGVASSRSVSDGAGPAGGGGGLATINSLDIRERSVDGRIPGDRQQPQG